MRAEFVSLIDQVQRWKDPELNNSVKIVVAGDFNARVGGLVDSILDHVTYPRGRWLLQEMQKRGFRLLNGTNPLVNGGYTFTNSRGCSTVDLVFISGENKDPRRID